MMDIVAANKDREVSTSWASFIKPPLSALRSLAGCCLKPRLIPCQRPRYSTPLILMEILGWYTDTF